MRLTLAVLFLLSHNSNFRGVSTPSKLFQKFVCDAVPAPTPPPAPTCNPSNGAWQVSCPGNTDCWNPNAVRPSSVGMVGNIAPATTLHVASVTCNATGPGQDFDGGTSTERFQVFFWNRAGGSIGYCTFPCNLGSTPAVITGTCNGVTDLVAGEAYRASTGMSVNIGCVAVPPNLSCSVNYTSP